MLDKILCDAIVINKNISIVGRNSLHEGINNLIER